MPLQRLQFAPGLVLDDTAVASEPYYADGNRVRFVRGQPQPIGGWSRRLETVNGVARALYPWINSARDRLLAVGSHSHLMVVKDGVLYDVTPAGLPVGAIDGGGVGGYGMGLYGTGGYGAGAVGSSHVRTWSLARWGDALVANPRGHTLYRWDGATGAPATPVSGAPATMDGFVVDPARFVVALGCIDQGTGQFDPMLARWCSQDDIALWNAASTNTAGQLPLSDGGRLVGGLAGSPTLIWSDTALYQMRLTTGEEVFSIPKVGSGCGLIGPNAAVQRDGRAYWMSTAGQFFGYAGGAPEAIPCPLLRHVFDNLQNAQADKITAGINGLWNEVWWFYPDARDGVEVSRYVAYNWAEQTWSAGRLARSAWIDASVFERPIAAQPGGAIYDHETGQSADGAALGESLTTGAIDLDDGDVMMRIDALYPDLKDQAGVLQFSLLIRDAPQGPEREVGPFAIGPGTERLPFQAQGRHVRIKLAGASAPSFWRMGAPRFDIKPTGMRH
jgi:hypothetical protein